MHTLYTLGYTGLKPAQLLAKAIELQAIVLDIRYSPRSRVQQWNGTELARLLGSRYQHLPALGNVNYKGDGPIQIDLPNVGTQQAISHLDVQSVIFMCVCPDVETCHRKVAAELVQAACGCDVIHLVRSDLANEKPDKPDGPFQQTLF